MTQREVLKLLKALKKSGVASFRNAEFSVTFTDQPAVIKPAARPKTAAVLAKPPMAPEVLAAVDAIMSGPKLPKADDAVFLDDEDPKNADAVMFYSGSG